MKILVGVPVFRVPDLVDRCLRSLTEEPSHVVVVDNAADGDVKKIIKRYVNRVRVIESATNLYCNGGWNLILQHGLTNGYDIIGLGSSDATLRPGWQQAISNRASRNSKEVWVASLTPSSAEADVVESVAGFFSFLPREAADIVYPIPAGIRHWFGDQYMFEKLRAHGWNIVVLNTLQATHQQSAITYRTPEAYGVIEQDKLAWKELRW